MKILLKVVISVFVIFFSKVCLGQNLKVNPRINGIDTVYSYCCKTIKFNSGDNIIYYKVYQKEQGIILREYSKINDTLNGTEIEYYENGMPKYIKQYLLGVPIGKFICYYPNGAVYSFYDYGYSPGDKMIEFKKYTRTYSREEPPYDEIVEVEGYYKPKSGLEYYFHNNGRIMKTESYVNGKLEGKTIYYDIDGNMIREEEYRDGRLVN